MRNNNRLDAAAQQTDIRRRLTRYRIGYGAVSHPIPLRSAVRDGVNERQERFRQLKGR
ncbi:MAG: hypothetical protein LZF60_250119 [Nitrospira sp.]|nr:MAG: hypothetical protein LZF60_250119 [Nitrospira sp.]